jgi:hypothetical protein
VRRTDAQEIAVREEGLCVLLRVLRQRLPGRGRRLDGAVIHVRQVHDVEDIVPGSLQMPPEQVLEEKSPEVSDVCVVPDRGAARVERHARRVQGLKGLDGAGERIEEGEAHVAAQARVTGIENCIREN